MSTPSAATASRSEPIRLGLIGSNIAMSRSPDLHRLCGHMLGLEISYELLVPADLDETFATVFARCRESGMRGVNVTYPYKELVAALVRVPDAEVALLGSINTVIFVPAGPRGYNTDYSGFIAAYRAAFAEQLPGQVAVVGAGGVGRAIAFALARLGASHLHLVDAEPRRAENLARALEGIAAPAPEIRVARDVAQAVAGTDGIVNCTPIGMTGHPGSAIDARLLGSQRWAFDAVYTPVETEFLRAARRADLATISGYELFFHQGIQAFELFTGRAPRDLDALRRQLPASAE